MFQLITYIGEGGSILQKLLNGKTHYIKITLFKMLSNIVHGFEDADHFAHLLTTKI